MRIKRNLFISLLVFLCGILTTAVGISFAWLSGATTEVNVEPLTGGVISQYFHCGTGSEEDPFVITKPVHLYNLTELYTLEDSFADEGYYFQLGYDLENNGILEFYEYDNDGKIVEDSYTDVLDMNYYENFRPIGSEDNPFNGTFEGSNLTINNLNISGEGVSDIGFFGYVSDSAKVQNLYIDNITIDTGDVEQGHHEHTNSYVGYIAGHIDDATCFENTYVNNCEIVGENNHIQNDWGYFGKCENAADSIQAFIDKANGQGQGDDWGGSIDSRSYNRWIYDLYKTSVTDQGGNTYEKSNMVSGTAVSPYTHNKKVFDDFTLRFGTAIKTEPTYNTKTKLYTKYTYYADPDNFNEPPDGHDVNTPSTGKPKLIVYQLKDDCYLPLRFEDDTRTSTHEENTGYLVGGSHGSQSSILGSPKLSSYYFSSIGNSLQSQAWTVGTAIANTTLGYTDSQLEVLTYTDAWHRISDSHNENNTVINANLSDYSKETVASLNLSKYNDSRNAIQNVCENSSRMNGIHFETVEVSNSNKITAPTAKINGNTYHNYELLKGSIQFNLKKAGRINFFAGTYYNQTRYFNFFSLYKIERNGNNITSVNRISKIYLNTDSNSTKYVYQYNGQSKPSNAGELVFDVSTTLEGDAPVNNALYYFEVPVNEGEYAMGMVPGKSASSYTGAYMIYLDLSSSGSTPGTTDVDDFTSIEYRSATDTVEHSILLLTYVYDNNVNLSIKVVYDNKKYYITAHSTNANLLLQVTVLNIADGYQYFVNNVEITDLEIKTYEYYV